MIIVFINKNGGCLMSQRRNDAFRKAGKRSTSQRRLVLDVLAEGVGHLDAEAVHDKVRTHNPRVSLATVYRSLGVLREMGLITQHRLGEDHVHFEAVRNGPHYHFKCLGCGVVTEFDAPEMTRIARRLGDREGARVTEAHLSMAGYCAKCNKMQKQATHGD
jgi:Fe2+ or Zn2+ uptake regulation protein